MIPNSCVKVECSIIGQCIVRENYSMQTISKLFNLCLKKFKTKDNVYERLKMVAQTAQSVTTKNMKSSVPRPK